MKHLLLLLCIALFVNVSASAQEYPVNAIPDSLKADARIVMRDYHVFFSQTDKNNATYSVKEVYTVLKESEGVVSFVEHCDKFRELKNFSGIMRDASGKIVRKYKKTDLKMTSLSESFKDDTYNYSCEFTSPVYPFTMEVEYELRYKNGILAYPPFTPVFFFQQSVQFSSYTIEFPADMDVRYRMNGITDVQKKNGDKRNSYVFALNGYKALPREPYAPSYREVSPVVLLAPLDFSFDNQNGNMSTWQTYGLWMAGLLKDRDHVSDEFAAKLKELVKNASDEKEKVEILYKYLQNNTRYVSVQLGIGGFQPETASHVIQMNFGDCKGLSNLLKGMLKVVGISSNYCEISTREKTLYKDFANVFQTDHAILYVPLKQEDIWLECTSNSSPFGYVHDHIAGHDALVIHEDGRGGEIVRLPAYPVSDNKTESRLEIFVHEDGGAEGYMAFTEHLHNYRRARYVFTSGDRKRQVQYINSNIKFPQAEIGQISILEDRSSRPYCRLETDFGTNAFASKTGNRLFIPICPLQKMELNVFSSEKRYFDIEIDRGFAETDSIIIHIPDHFVIESMPKPVDIETDFGKIKTELKQDGKTITYIQNIEIASGKYEKSRYREIKNFFSQIIQETNRRLTIKKG